MSSADSSWLALGGFWASMCHLQRLLEMGPGGKTSRALCSGGESSHAKRHGLFKSPKQQNYILDSFSVFIC